MKRKRINATRLATVMAPLATRKPPTPNTTRNATCSAIPEIGTTKAEIFATSTPILYAPSASRLIDPISRSVAFAARTVRMALMARSTLAVRSPTRSWALREAARIRRERVTTVVTATATTTMVRLNRTLSRINMAMTAPMKVSAPPIASTSPWVSTARSRVVSEPTLDTRSPVRRSSNSRMGKKSIRRTSVLRDESTTPSPVRCSK